MFKESITFLKDQLTHHIGDSDRVTFIENNEQKQIVFKDDAITILLANLEEERTFKAGAAPVSGQDAFPLSLNLYLLFVPNFADYSQTLDYLSSIVGFFQANRVFEHQDFPELSPDIEKLTLELISLSYYEQFALWKLLGRVYIPSALYRVRMIVIRDKESVSKVPEITAIETKLLKIDS